MKSEKIIIANLKCDGCATTIKNKLLAIDGVKNVEVNHDEDTVTVECREGTERHTLVSKLAALGYPEATEENGLLMQIKSYASCMLGRVSNL